MRSTFFGIRLLHLCVLLLYWTICATPAVAGPGVVELNAETTRVELAPVGLWLADPGSTLTIADVQRAPFAEQFSNADPGELDRVASARWLRYRLRNTSTQPLNLLFDTQKYMGLEFEIHAADGQGGMRKQTSSPDQSFLQRPLPTPTLSFPLVVPANASIDVLVRIRTHGLGTPNLAPLLWRPDVYQAQNRHIASRWFAYLGLVVGLTLFNLGLFAFTRNAGFLRYVLSTLGIAALVATNGYGFAYEYFWPDSPLFQRAAQTLSTMAATYFATLFIDRLIDLRRHLPRLHLYLQVVLLLTLGLHAIDGFIYTFLQVEFAWLRDGCGELVSFTTLGLFLPLFGAIAWVARQGDRSARLQLVAWLPMFFVVLMVSIAELNKGWFGPVANLAAPLYMLASAFEIIFTALMLADQFNRERRERIRAQQALVDELRRSERELEDKVELRTRELQSEQGKTQALLQRNQELLHNMLPIEIAEELAQTGTSRPVRHESTTILFTDFSGFTQAASTMPPARVVAELNEIFAAFDDITSDCGVEKIKTIGDAYMAAAGVVTHCEDHAQRCVQAGLRMIAYLEERNREASFKWTLRVGIHSGPVVAGVVGTKKFAFDIWGDTVNLAARMESSGEIGRVNISAYTYDLVRDAYVCSYRGKVTAKGKGEIDMYFVESRVGT